MFFDEMHSFYYSFFCTGGILHASNVDGFRHLIRHALCRMIQSLKHTVCADVNSFLIQFTIYSSLSVRIDNSKCENTRWKWKWSVMATYWICVIRVLQCRNFWCELFFCLIWATRRKFQYTRYQWQPFSNWVDSIE